MQSLWGRAGQLLLVEAHDMVHKLVLLARLDHAAPAGRDTWCRRGYWALGGGGDPQAHDHQAFVGGLVFVLSGGASPWRLLPSAPCCPSQLGPKAETERTCPSTPSPCLAQQLSLSPPPAPSCLDPAPALPIRPFYLLPASPRAARPLAPRPMCASGSPGCPWDSSCAPTPAHRLTCPDGAGTWS